MTWDLRQCVARIESLDGRVIGGTGFVITDDLVLTCAHVVKAAKGCPGVSVRLTFQNSKATNEARVTADGWFENDDLAFLRLISPLPSDVFPVPLGFASTSENHSFRALGYPSVGEFRGIWAEGQILGKVVDAAGRHMLQLRAQEITLGMSGAPVLDVHSEHVVGVVSLTYNADESLKLRDVAFAIPIDTAIARHPRLMALQVREDRLRTGVPYQVPPLPSHFVPRPEVFETIKTRLLASSKTVPGTLVVSVIHGLGGIGKSTLVAALAHDEQVQAHYHHGILWATLGQHPDLLSILNGWIQALGDYNFQGTLVEAASAHLRTLLRNRAVLLVVDDVWDSSSVLPFQFGGNLCQLLVTTRRADVAETIGASLYELDVMTESQSMALLSRRLGRSLEKAECEQALRLAAAIGYLPLALELAAVRIQRGVTWNALIEALEREVAHLEALEGPGRRRGGAKLEASFRLSLNALRVDDEQSWRAFLLMGILPEDVQITAPMAATLWDVRLTEASEILEFLWNDALLLPASHVQVEEVMWPSYRLHDLLHDLACRALNKNPPSGLGLDFEDAHSSLLDRYKKLTHEDSWHTLPDDGYIHKHLMWHMRQANQSEEVHELLTAETEAGNNAWYEVREALGQTGGYLDDVRQAWLDLVGHPPFNDDRPHLEMTTRYAFMMASLHSLAKNVPPSLLIILMEEHLWTSEQVLTYIRQVPNLAQRVAALLEVIPHMSSSMRSEAIREVVKVVPKIRDVGIRATALVGLLPYLPQSDLDLVLRDTLKFISQIMNPQRQSRLIAELTPYLPDTLLGRTFSVVKSIDSSRWRTKVLVGLLPWIPPLMMDEALTALNDVRNEAWRLQALIKLSRYLPEPRRERILEEIREMTRTDSRASALVRVGSRLGPQAKSASMKEALSLVLQIKNERRRSRSLVQIVPHLSQALQREVLSKLTEIERVSDRTKILMRLGPHLAHRFPREIVDVAQNLETAGWRAQTLLSLYPYLPGPTQDSLLSEIFGTIQKIEHPQWQVELLINASQYLSDEMKREVLQQALSITDAINSEVVRSRLLANLVVLFAQHGDLHTALGVLPCIPLERRRAAAIVMLAPYSHKALISDSLKIVESIGDEQWKTKTLIGLAPHLPESLVEEVFLALRESGTTRERVQALTELVPYITDQRRHDCLRDTLVLAQQIEDQHLYVDALSGLLLYTDTLLREKLLNEALAVARQIVDPFARAHALDSLIAYLPSHLSDIVAHEILASVRSVEDGWLRTETLIALASRYEEPARHELALEALTSARGIPHEASRGRALRWICSRLAELGYVQTAFETVQEVDGSLRKERALIELTPYLPDPLTKVRKTKHWLHQARELAALIPHLSEPKLREVIGILRGMHSDGQSLVFVELSRRWIELQCPEDALIAATEIRDKQAQARVLTELTPHLHQDMIVRALKVVRSIRSIDDRAKAMSGLAAHLSPQEVADLLSQVNQMPSQNDQAMVLSRITPYLPVSLLKKALRATCEIEIASNRERVWDSLVPRLAVLPAETLWDLWQEALLVLSSRTRRELFSDVRVCLPIVTALGGTKGATEVFRAVQSVTRWWP